MADTIRDAAFAHRLSVACDAYPLAPPQQRGRLTWLSNELKARFGTKVSIETARKWFGGVARPRPDKMAQIAELLQVDVAWLSLGLKPVEKPKERAARNARANGAVNVVAGFIQLGGGTVAFPKQDDTDVDFYAILRGEQIAFSVKMARPVSDDDGSYAFDVPQQRDDLTVLGVLPREGFEVEVYHLPNEVLDETAAPHGGYATVEALARRTGLEIGHNVIRPLRALRDPRDLDVGISVGS